MSPSTLPLSEVARHVVIPEGIVTTGWPSVRNTCANLGLGFDAWQDGIGRLILGRRKDGLYAADTVVISIPRQVGKTYLLGAIVFALCLIHPGLTVIWTAHRFKTATETFNSMRTMARRKRMAAHVDKVMQGAGNEAIWFRNGSRIMFGARERGFGRGFAKVDVLVLDEAQILTESAMEDMVPATNVSPDPLILLTGTPPRPRDPGEVFSSLRTEALAGESSGTVYVEISADKDTDPNDRAQWRKANPSYPHRTPERAILRMKKNLGEESFLREGLGVWDELTTDTIPDGSWRACADPAGQVDGPAVFAVDMAWDRSRVVVGVAGLKAGVDGVTQVELAGSLSASEVAERLKERTDRVWLDSGGPAAALIPDLEAAGLVVEKLPRSEVVAACGGFYDAVVAGSLGHLDDPDLNSAVRGARLRGGEAYVFTRKGMADISPLYAVTIARYALGQSRDLALNVW